jgi:hypothetical protein
MKTFDFDDRYKETKCMGLGCQCLVCASGPIQRASEPIVGWGSEATRADRSSSSSRRPSATASRSHPLPSTFHSIRSFPPQQENNTRTWLPTPPRRSLPSPRGCPSPTRRSPSSSPSPSPRLPPSSVTSSLPSKPPPFLGCPTLARTDRGFLPPP